MSKDIRVRIAPSPTGYVHVGNTYTAYYNYIFAQQNQGRFILRLDDTDQERHVSDAEEVVYKLWKWLGMEWDEGPDIGGPMPNYRQSERLTRYQEQAEKLVSQDLAYKKDGAVFFKVLPGEAVIVKDLIRGDVQFERENLKDFVIIKSNGYPTYQFATVVDEIDFNITHVIRAEDHLSNTPIQVLAIEALGGKVPLYAHLPLLRNPDHSKLSKRQSHTSLAWYKEKGILPTTLKNFFALMGWSHPEQKEIFTEDEFIKLFSFERVNTSAPIFDLEKLMWMNGMYIRQTSVEELANLIEQYTAEFAPEYSEFIKSDYDKFLKVVKINQERLRSFDEFWELASYFYQEPELNKQDFESFIADQTKREEFIKQVQIILANNSIEWKAEKLEEVMRALQVKLDLKPKEAFMTLRVILTGKKNTPPLFDTMVLLGSETCLLRLEKALNG